MDEDQTERNHRNSGRADWKTLTWEKQIAAVRSMFPFVSSKTAFTERHFVRGYACSCRIFAMETREEWESMEKYLDAATEEYQRSYEETGTPEAIANLLWALCLGYTFSADVKTVGVESEEYTGHCYETGMLLIGILREYKAYEELAEYYHTLLHVIGMDGNGAGVDINKKVGRT